MDSEMMDELKQLAKRIMEIANKCGAEESDESESMEDEGSEESSYSSKGANKIGAAMKLFGKKA